MSISAMKQALEVIEAAIEAGDWKVDGACDPDMAIHSLRQAIAEAEKQEPAFYVIPATDRFGEGYEQTYWEDPAGFPVYTRPVYASDISQKPVDETAKDRHKTDCKKDFDLLFEANSADIEALQDAQFTLEAIKSADPGTHDEIIDASLHLIKLALSNSVFGPIERIAERYGVEI
jgi:hypothetical protein